MSDKIQLTKEEWTNLIENKLEGDSPDGQVLRVMAQLPSLIRRARPCMEEDWLYYIEILELYDEACEIRKQLQPVLVQIRGRLHSDDLNHLAEFTGAPSGYPLVHSLYVRSYGFALISGIIIDLICDSLDMSQGASHLVELRHFAKDIIALALISRQCRPLGSMLMMACLCASYAATEDAEIQSMSATLLEEYRLDFAGPDTRRYDGELQCLRQR